MQMHHGLAFSLLLVPVLFTDNAGKVSIHDNALQFPRGCVGIFPVFSIVTGLIAEMLLALFFVCNGLK